MKYTTLLLDADNTLLDFDAAEDAALKAVYINHQIPVNDDTVETYVRLNLSLWEQLERKEITREQLLSTRFKTAFEALGYPCEDPVAVNKEYSDLLASGHQMIEGAMETVIELAKHYDLAIVTNGNIKTQRQRLKESGLDQIIKKVFISELVGANKPSPAYFKAVFEGIEEKDRSRILLVGDSLTSDILGAVNSGIDSCWINPKGNISKEITPTYIVKSINELPELLKKQATHQ